LIQPGNREWVTAIQGVNSQGWTVPPFIVVADKKHLASWYKNSGFPPDWVIAVTDNGWTTNEKGIDWIWHFEKHTKARTISGYRLLILDGCAAGSGLGTEKGIGKTNLHLRKQSGRPTWSSPASSGQRYINIVTKHSQMPNQNHVVHPIPQLTLQNSELPGGCWHTIILLIFVSSLFVWEKGGAGIKEQAARSL
jgi:hypothetical protein